MKVTYIGHSGFLVEWETCYWLFDYYLGTIPKMDAVKRKLVFVSHKHSDHFNSRVFELYHNYTDVVYVLSSDIEASQVDPLIAKSIVFVESGKQYELHDGRWGEISLKTLESTDCGVAFVLRYLGKTVYHAGDLNLWVWKEETKRYNDEMTTMFNEQIAALKDVLVDVAFVPLDPRQEEFYYRGMESFLNTTNARYVFPMHFGTEYSIIDRYKRERANPGGAQIMSISRAGQEWNIDV